MKKKSKGFTLIELLAVIVILAVIALVATPIVLNIINRARKGAFARSADGLLKASKNYYAFSLLEPAGPESISFVCTGSECKEINNKLGPDGNPLQLDISGSIGNGEVNIDEKGRISFQISNGKYCARKAEGSDEIIISDGLCNPDTTPPTIAESSPATSRTASEIMIYYTITDDNAGAYAVCSYAEQGQSLKTDSNVIADSNGCRVKNLKSDTTYDYKVCAKDLAGNESTTCLTGSVKTLAATVKPVITEPDDSRVPDTAVFNDSTSTYYLKEQTIHVEFPVTGLTNPKRYIKSEDKGGTVVTTGVTAYACTAFDACDNTNSVTVLTADTLYLVSGDLDIKYNGNAGIGNLAAFLYDGTSHLGTEDYALTSTESNAPSVAIVTGTDEPRRTTNSILVTATVSDTESGIRFDATRKDVTCTYGTNGIYDNDGVVQKGTGDSYTCLMNNLTAKDDDVAIVYNYKICATDQVGNGPSCDQGTSTVITDAIPGIANTGYRHKTTSGMENGTVGLTEGLKWVSQDIETVTFNLGVTNENIKNYIKLDPVKDGVTGVVATSSVAMKSCTGTGATDTCSDAVTQLQADTWYLLENTNEVTITVEKQSNIAAWTKDATGNILSKDETTLPNIPLASEIELSGVPEGSTQNCLDVNCALNELYDKLTPAS